MRIRLSGAATLALLRRAVPTDALQAAVDANFILLTGGAFRLVAVRLPHQATEPAGRGLLVVQLAHPNHSELSTISVNLHTGIVCIQSSAFLGKHMLEAHLSHVSEKLVERAPTLTALGEALEGLWTFSVFAFWEYAKTTHGLVIQGRPQGLNEREAIQLGTDEEHAVDWVRNRITVGVDHWNNVDVLFPELRDGEAAKRQRENDAKAMLLHIMSESPDCAIPQVECRLKVDAGVPGLRHSEFLRAWRQACDDFKKGHPTSPWGRPGRPRR